MNDSKTLVAGIIFNALMVLVVYFADVLGKDFNSINGLLMFFFAYLSAICAVGLYRVKNGLEL